MIHKTAIIDSNAKISANVKIGAYSLIGPNVEIDENSEIQSHVSIIGNTKIGRAAKKINTLDPETVYTTLIDDLPYDETKHYLKKVTKRMSLY